MSNNKSLVLGHIWKNSGSYRKEIASVLGLHPNLVSDAVRELIKEEWVTEGEPKTGSTGRAPISLYIDMEKRAALSVSYDRRGVVCALINAAGDITKKIELDSVPGNPEQLAEMLAQTLERIQEDYPGRIIGVGLADPGMVDSARGEVVRSSSFPEWHRVPLARLLKEKTGLAVLVENNTPLRAMAHYLMEPGLRQADGAMLYLDYGYGIGFALVTPDGVWRGSGFAGELGHVVLEPGGRLCGCGARGCLESLANSKAVEEKAKALLAEGANSVLRSRKKPGADAVFQAALEGDRLARSVVEEIMSHLGLATAFLAAAFHPRHIVVGGESGAAIRCLSREIASAVQNLTLPEIASSIEVVEGKELQHMALTGAALMIFEKTIMTKGGASARTNAGAG